MSFEAAARNELNEYARRRCLHVYYYPVESPEHGRAADPWIVDCSVDGQRPVRKSGRGMTKEAAENDAAAKVLEQLRLESRN
ncbi:hypothetical protein BOTBODRAFT_55160 [Botryobasidium botryosum FD-172 SS1]|uniref:DRBM domain-containing protein n=1 Tax=Botryobasidium botryosum (strain FD-172 SS1) TaxID=930990 RepID=A0A067MGF3_BOTB1|nr:hypothetical protein BOTBODRAFT_55160 [Botryobasidium botryosum FD-172 SS1]